MGWILFAITSKAQHAQREALILLMELRAAASAVSAGNGSHASLALLRHVLATHGWLPPPNATPLQVLARSHPPVRSLFPLAFGLGPGSGNFQSRFRGNVAPGAGGTIAAGGSRHANSDFRLGPRPARS